MYYPLETLQVVLEIFARITLGCILSLFPSVGFSDIRFSDKTRVRDSDLDNDVL